LSSLNPSGAAAAAGASGPGAGGTPTEATAGVESTGAFACPLLAPPLHEANRSPSSVNARIPGPADRCRSLIACMSRRSFRTGFSRLVYETTLSCDCRPGLPVVAWDIGSCLNVPVLLEFVVNTTLKSITPSG